MTATQNETAVTRVQYQPDAPIASPHTLKALLQAQATSLQSVLPKHVTPERLMKTMLVAVNRVPNLLACTQASVLETINRAGELGLDLSGTLGEAYPVPYGKQCQLIIGYRGLAKLARQTGEVATITADVVCRNDRFTFRKGGNAICEWEPPLDGERGEIIGAFAHVQFKDGTQQFDYMTVAEINKIKARSRSGNNGPWVTDWAEMAKKTVFRRLSKWLPLSAEKWTAAMEHDDATAGAIEVEPEPVRKPGQSKSDALLEQLKPEPEAAAPEQEQATVPEPAPEPMPEAPPEFHPLVGVMVDKCGCSPEGADEAIRAFCRASVWACDLEDLDDKQRNEVRKLITSGKLKP